MTTITQLKSMAEKAGLGIKFAYNKARSRYEIAISNGQYFRSTGEARHYFQTLSSK